MRAKQPRIVITFHTTADAMAMEQLCGQLGIPGKLFSAPRALSSDCGIAWQSPPEEKPTLEQAITENRLEIHGLYELMV